LIFTDPNGEFIHLIIGAFIGGIVNVIVNSKNLETPWKFLTYFGIGAVAGALSAGVGMGVSSALASGGSFMGGFLGTATTYSTGFFAGAVSGAASGFSGGFLTGTSNIANSR
jgi:hypothetical protein